MKTQLAILGIVLLTNGNHVQGQDWKACEGPLKTRWAKDVSPGNALPEYPRMQMVRQDWLNLNGLWDLKLADGTGAKILVPYPVESALSGVMKHSDRLTYRRAFEVPKEWGHKRVLLHFGAVDWEAKVSVNGKELGTHRGGYDGFSFDITDSLTASGPQELTVTVFDPTDAGQQPHGKQVLKPGGIMYTPCSGIWQTVWLEPVSEAGIESLQITPDLDGGTVRVKVNARFHGPIEEAVRVVAVALEAGKEVARVKGEPGEELRLPIANPHLWSPDDPFLYDLRIEMGQDAVTSYFGMRKIAIAKDDAGVNRLMLNGKFVFQVGPLDQGFWPDGIYTAPTDEALRFDVESTKKLGMNCTRKHVKVEPDRWYYWCDKLGLLVWQDMAAGGNGNAEAKKQFEVELKRLIEGRWTHPSIIMWVVFNEGWGQYDTERLTAWVKRMDPSRLVNNASGWTDQKCGDVIDMHNYPGPGSPKPEATRAAVLGEFGGLGLGVDGHTWTKQTWGYRGMSSREELTRSYVKLLTKAWALKDNPGLCAVIYTQITDVESECNGLLTYDREVVKVDLQRAADANRGNLLPPAEVNAIVPTSQQNGVRWRYVIEKPAGDWLQPGFDDSAWKEGLGGFGTKGTPGAIVRTEWKNDDIWLRRSFEWPAGKIENPYLLVHHDEDVEVYINGVLAGKAGGYITDYEEMPLTPEGRTALRPGKNVFAVHCHQTQGGQYIDVGIISLIEKPQR
ncbi:MAG: sugar-binding domain-containing protein [Verrucomicrobiota bacterium]|jgi:hypothetical protein